MAKKQVQLKSRVLPLWREDVFKDIIRVPEGDRGGISEGTICAISVNGYVKQAIVRGLEEKFRGRIMIDEMTRKAMGDLQEGAYYNFTIKEVGIWRLQLQYV